MVRPLAGDVVLVAKVVGTPWVSSMIQRHTRSWYAHVLLALGRNRFVHAVPGPQGAIVYLEGGDGLAAYADTGAVYDLYRPKNAPDESVLLACISDLHSLATQDPQTIKLSSGFVTVRRDVVFSDGTILALTFLHKLQQWPNLFESDRAVILRNAVVLSIEDYEGRLFCSSFVHRVLDAAGSRPAAPPVDESFIDLSGFPTDEKPTRGPTSQLENWLKRTLWSLTGFDPDSITTVREVAAGVRTHYDKGAEIVDKLHVANFVTPADLAKSPSLERIASCFRSPVGNLTPWLRPERMPPYVGRS